MDQWHCVAAIAASCAGAQTVTARLQALGFLVGEPVRLLRRSWLRRGPLVVQIGNATFALRQDEAECIDVQTLGQAV